MKVERESKEINRERKLCEKVREKREVSHGLKKKYKTL